MWAQVAPFWLAALAAPGAWSQAEQTVQYPLKLAFIYNVTKFVQWPPEVFDSASAALVICIVGQDPFPADAERELRSRTTGGRPIGIQRITARDDLATCHVIFISDAEQKNAAGLLARSINLSVLTIGESKGFVESGGVVNLLVHDSNIRFEINPVTAERKRLIISSRLLVLAKIVRTEQ
jgi:hypothetical protein